MDVTFDSEMSEEELIIEAPNRKIENFESMLTDIILPDEKHPSKSPVCKYYQVPLEDTDGLLKSKLPADFLRTFDLTTKQTKKLYLFKG